MMTLWHSITECETIEDTDSAQTIPELTTVYTMGAAIIGEKKDRDTMRIVKIVSTNPSLYLNPDLQPGQFLSMRSLPFTRQ